MSKIGPAVIVPVISVSIGVLLSGSGGVVLSSGITIFVLSPDEFFEIATPVPTAPKPIAE